MRLPLHHAVLTLLLAAPAGGMAQSALPRPKDAHPPVVQPKPGTQAKPAPAPAPTHRAHAPKAVAKPPVPAPAPAPVVVPPPPEKPAEPEKGSSSGRPLPRFETLRSGEVNMRIGPGTRYQIAWIYQRRDLPVLIEREFDIWRQVRDSDGIQGWVNQAVLAPRRTGVVTGGDQMLRADPRDDGAPVARLKPGVILRLRSCEAAAPWCQALVQDYRGWIKRSEFWGTQPGEAIP